jgi:hypothetical protein
VFAFRTAVAREPRDRELSVLKKIYAQELQHYTADTEAAKKLVSQGKYERPEQLNVTELAAWTAIGNVLLNLDETITRE